MKQMDTTYESFLAKKAITTTPAGFDFDTDAAYPFLFGFQSYIVKWALRRGRAAAFCDTGTGKTRMEIAFSDAVCKHTSLPVIIVCPMSVAPQTVAEGVKVGITVTRCKSQADVRPGINITNYERLHLFDPSAFGGLVIDESGILKSFNGATKQAICDFGANIPFRLAATATPAPNDYTEIGNHAEFLGIMSRVEMLATFFTHDGGETSVWRLRGWAKEAFWAWVASWAIMCRKPGDVGFPEEDARYDLPPLHIIEHKVKSKPKAISEALFEAEASTLSEQRVAKRDSMDDRIAEAVKAVNAAPTEKWVVWCSLNDEQDRVAAIFGDQCVSIQGSTEEDKREAMLASWLTGDVPILVSKGALFGFGLNFQVCANAVTVGVDHSHESMYQIIRRNWRFGQTRPVNFHMIYSEQEAAVVRSLQRKQKDASIMQDEMVAAMRKAIAEGKDAVSSERETVAYKRDVKRGPGWANYLGDCVDVMRDLPSESIHYSVFSPPFASLYTYSNSDRDMGNCRSHSEFYGHFKFAVAELYRLLKPGRLVSFHCMNLPVSKERDGYIGIADFRGDLIRMFRDAGFIYHSEVCIWKDPVTAMQRTKAIGLLHKQIEKDSAMSRQGIPDYLVTMRKPGENTEPIAGKLTEYHGDESGFMDTDTNARSRSIEIWQRYASPVWMDINPSDTLQFRSVRETNDERHICCLQLQVVKRGVQLWSNPGDTVLSCFSGIASEGDAALEMGREFIGIELKPAYWKQGCANLAVRANNKQNGLFDDGIETGDLDIK